MILLLHIREHFGGRLRVFEYCLLKYKKLLRQFVPMIAKTWCLVDWHRLQCCMGTKFTFIICSSQGMIVCPSILTFLKVNRRHRQENLKRKLNYLERKSHVIKIPMQLKPQNGKNACKIRLVLNRRPQTGLINIFGHWDVVCLTSLLENLH